MEKKTLDDYRRAIESATTHEELAEISYTAFLADENALTGKRTLYNRVVSMCVKRETELGIL